MATEPKSLAPSGELEDEMLRTERATKTDSRSKRLWTKGRAPREYELLTNHYLFETVTGQIELPDDEEIVWDWIEAKGNAPAHWAAWVLGPERKGMTIFLKDGLEPDKQGEIRGPLRIEIKAREVQAPDLGNEVNVYHYINLYPAAADDNSAKGVVRLFVGNGKYGSDSNGFGIEVIPL